MKQAILPKPYSSHSVLSFERLRAMQHGIKITYLLWLLLLSTTGVVAQTDNPRIGYVDMKQLLDSAPQIALSRESIDREFRPQSDAINTDEERLHGLREQLQTREGTDKDALEQRSRNLELSINRRREDLRQQILFRRNEAIQDLEDDINQAVATVARTRNYDLIISSPVIYANSTVDLTQQVLRHLEQQNNSQSN